MTSAASFTANQMDDVSDYLWNNSLDLAKETLHLEFLNKLKSYTMKAERYLKFTLQDMVYLDGVTAMLKEMSEKVTEPEDLKVFIEGRHSSYKKFRDSCLQSLSIKDLNSIEPMPAMQKYLDTYREVMKESDPVYFVVALLPCPRAWSWIAQNLQLPKHSVHYIRKSDSESGQSEKHYRPILNKYLNSTEKLQKANDIFRRQMQNEHDFFYTS
ncbi:uncharacterized protein LOC119261944 [Pygocentrus nattereri]|uniref:Thiaminase-2/PQQC domain-containing protein n=1 Tax=Pygocentrus nattereri TaxID=42514 RepID=A0AAR2JNW8_PYGNA|nr:uncharacterized protein LOC119261939 [Pygocentrus nattereri]XP_037388370.1 uncharacterized protein LOC119261940 [Pygocentrus nattereri]XP_037388373.1 uncharacterized protein LOC119261941 [Pygocentrus nattereri]XP_037388380.1 uncharacterized protein LOC119261944 [Pygocentrus nattereri]